MYLPSCAHPTPPSLSQLGPSPAQVPEACDPVFANLIQRCFAGDPKERPDFHEIFTKLNNYYKELEAASGNTSDSRIPAIPIIIDDGHPDPSLDGTLTKTATEGRPTLGRRSLLAVEETSEDSDDSDDSSSSSSGDEEAEWQEMVRQYVPTGGDKNSILVSGSCESGSSDTCTGMVVMEQIGAQKECPVFVE